MAATGHGPAKAPAAAASVAGVPVHGGTLTTTFRHPFYDQTQAAFTDAEYLHAGDILQTPAGTAQVTAVRLFHANTTTYDLTIDGLHTYYVEAGTTPVLVHNASSCWSIRGRMRAAGPGDEFGLPSQGRIRYVPPEGYNPANSLPHGPGNGYIDRFGNEWTVGPSRTEGHPFEWGL